MAPEQNIETINSIYQALKESDWDAVATLIDEDSFAVHEAPTLSYCGVFRGLDGLKRLICAFSEQWSESAFEFKGFSTGDDIVIGHLEARLTARSNGKSYAMPVLEVWRLREGRIVELRPFYWDTGMISASEPEGIFATAPPAS